MLAAALAVATAACGAGAPSASPSTRTISRQPAASATLSPGLSIVAPTPNTSLAVGAPSPPEPLPAGSGIRGRAVVLNCPVDRADPPCPATPVQARVVVLSKGARPRLTPTPARGSPSSTYTIRASVTGNGPARRPATRQVTIAAGRHTTVTIRLITDLQ